MNPEFKVHRLNEEGLQNAEELASSFDSLLETVKRFVPAGRYLAVVKTKLEEACFFAKKGIAEQEKFNVPKGA